VHCTTYGHFSSSIQYLCNICSSGASYFEIQGHFSMGWTCELGFLLPMKLKRRPKREEVRPETGRSRPHAPRWGRQCMSDRKQKPTFIYCVVVFFLLIFLFDLFIEQLYQNVYVIYRVSQKSRPLQLSTIFSLGLSLFP